MLQRYRSSRPNSCIWDIQIYSSYRRWRLVSLDYRHYIVSRVNLKKTPVLPLLSYYFYLFQNMPCNNATDPRPHKHLGHLNLFKLRSSKKIIQATEDGI